MADSKTVQPTLSAEALAYIDQLIEIGGYGKNPSEVARYLISRELDDLLRAKVLTPNGRKSEK